MYVRVCYHFSAASHFIIDTFSALLLKCLVRYKSDSSSSDCLSSMYFSLINPLNTGCLRLGPSLLLLLVSVVSVCQCFVWVSFHLLWLLSWLILRFFLPLLQPVFVHTSLSDFCFAFLLFAALMAY